MKKWFKRIVACGIVLTLAGWLTGSWLLRSWTAKPPPLPPDTKILRCQAQERDGKLWLGRSWLSHREGLPVLYLKGSSFDIGYAGASLLQTQIHTLENEFIDMIHGYVPHEWTLRVLKSYVIYRNRHLSDFVPFDCQMQVLGSTIGCPDIHPELGAYYNRVLNYHAAHDISYMMIDNPLTTRAGCTSFAAWGGATGNGHLITGRNFDWEAAEVFSRDRVVVMCEPDEGIPYISLAWAGMAGVVSGMNRAGVSVTLNGAPSSLPSETATPVAIVARDLLQHSQNLAQALDTIRNAKVFVSTLWLVGSRVDGKFVVVEKTPDATHVREPENDSIICANHFQTSGLDNGARNLKYIREATSISRQSRMSELVQQERGKLNPESAAAILRDRNLPGGAFAGNGHRGALNALIATHATVMDLSEGIFWAASPPNQLGKFVAFDLQDFSHELPERTILPDPMLASGEFERARVARTNLLEGQHLLKEGKTQEALELADKAEALNPHFYQNSMLRGRALLALGKSSEAAHAFDTALSEQPAFLKERQELESLSQKAKAAKAP
jgi:hypothetical protein